MEAECGIPAVSVEALRRLGHDVLSHAEVSGSWPLGGAQFIAVDQVAGTLIGASDPRLDGCALGY